MSRSVSNPMKGNSMRKRKLRLDDLSVETFGTGEAHAPRRGTIGAHEATVKVVCAAPTLRTDLTCCPCTPML